MKIKFFMTALIIFIGVSCTQDNESENNVKNIYSTESLNLGKLHNEFMTAVKNDFVPEIGNSYQEELKQLVEFFETETDTKSSLSNKEKQDIKKSFNNLANLANYKYLQDIVNDQQLVYNAISKQETTFSQYIVDLGNAKIVSSSEMKSIVNLHQILKNIYKQNYTIHDLNNYLLNVERQDDHFIMGVSLNIGDYSNEWWHNNLDDIYLPNRNSMGILGVNSLDKKFPYDDIDVTIVNGLPVFVANDIAGALVGAVFSGAVQYAVSGSVNWGAVGLSALGGAVTGSTGMVGKIGGWISKW